MVLIPCKASNQQVLDIVRHWIDVLAREDYDQAFTELGQGCSYTSATGGAAIRADIQRYRSSEYFPGVTEFVVTDWRTAQGGNPQPLQQVTWFKPDAHCLRGAVAFDLPLNGRWSDLRASFVFTKHTAEFHRLGLEDIYWNWQKEYPFDEQVVDGVMKPTPPH